MWNAADGSLNQRDSNTPEDGSYERNLAQRYRTNCLALLRRARQVEMEGVSDTFCAALLMFFIGEVSQSSLLGICALMDRSCLRVRPGTSLSA
jgi:hypothetical protein